jgi:hypothetical protein
MTEKIGQIKNPLTIIAIFAGIAEVSGTLVLPFVSEANQFLFIYFLIAFPSVLILLFFVTLNFNNKVLYAPSDYKDEDNYISVNRYDFSQQKNVEIKLSKDDSTNQLLERLLQMEFKMTQLESLLIKNSTERNIAIEDATADNRIETTGYKFLVSNFRNVSKFLTKMSSVGVNFEVYNTQDPNEPRESNYQDHRAIWLGADIPLELAQLVIKESKRIYPHLKYIKISDPGDRDFNQIYIGGSTDSAVSIFNRTPMTEADFEKLNSYTDKKEFHRYIEKFSK